MTEDEKWVPRRAKAQTRAARPAPPAGDDGRLDIKLSAGLSVGGPWRFTFPERGNAVPAQAKAHRRLERTRPR